MSDSRSDRRRGRRGVVRSFVVGGLVGAAAAVVAPRLRKGRAPAARPVAGLEAFEGAPCWQEDAEPAPASGE
ncbi:MAG TPA: hypothetical protein VGJ11_05870 [Gaiellales bacterium]